MLNLETLEQNPFFSAGLFFMVLGGVLVYLRALPGLLYDLIERFFIVKVEVRDEDEAYQWLQLWLAERLRETLSISIVTRRSRIHNPDYDPEGEANAAQPSVYFVPAVGTYFFRYRGRFVVLHRDRRERPMGGVTYAGASASQSGQDRESFTLRIFSRDRSLARSLIEECRDLAIPNDGKLTIRVANYGAWTLSARVASRPLGSVVLDGDQAGLLLADMREFLACQQWYHATGVPYRRGYLLYGPPGNGKSSVVKALASELGMSVYLLMLSDPEMNDNRINDLLGRVPDRNLLLLEDVDCAFAQRQRNTGNGQNSGLTFAGLLNALDGVAAPEGRIVIMTTNHIDRLDPALIRPGRADVKLLFDNATTAQAQRLFERFFPEHGELAVEFANEIADRAHCMAAIQEHLMAHRGDPRGAIRNAGELREMCAVSPQKELQIANQRRKKRRRKGHSREISSSHLTTESKLM